MVDTPNKKFPLMASNQSQKHVTYNEMLIDMDVIVQSSVISASVATPPGSPTEGDTYIIPASATGAWSGHEDKITMWYGGAWVIQTPHVGWRCWDQETSELLVFDGSAWTSLLDSMLSAGVLDTVFTLNDNVDTTKKLRFELSDITTNTTRILTVPDANGTIALLDASQTFTTTTTFAGATVDVGTATGDSTYGLGTGATTTGQTKTINIGTNGDSGSTTIVNIGSTNTGALGSTIINSPTVTFAASVAEIGASAANISALYLGLGGATADSNNRFSINSPQVLLNNAGAGHQLKINKANAGDTASLLFQTGFSGRAEMGTAGSDDFVVKVSADGSNWNTALTADAGTGALTFGTPLGVASGGTGGATAAAARGNLGLGTAATLDATASATDVTSGRVLRNGDLGVRSPLNVLPDSGTFRGIRAHMTSNDNTFSRGHFFSSYNGSTFANGGDFIYNNSTFGGWEGPLNTAMQDLLSAMGRSGSYGRYGITFSILQITAGSGTAGSDVGPDTVTRYLASVASSTPVIMSWGDRQTWVMWARVVSGSVHTTGEQVFINEVPAGTSALIPGTWSRIVAHRTTSGFGYYPTTWALFAAPGSVIELACVGLFFDLVQPRFWNAPLASSTSQLHVVGTVDQSGGVPTGALMECGSNANGRYVRYADGTQICTHQVTVSLDISGAFMGGFRSGGQTWTYPATFAAAPQLSVTPLSLSAFGGVADTVDTSSALWAVTSVTAQTAATRSVSLTAVGRWF